MNFPKRVIIKEVGPRDGLQNEPEMISTEHKIEWINRNVATDDFLYMFHGLGIQTGVDFGKLLHAAEYIQKQLHKPLPSHQMQIIHHQNGSEQQ